MLERNLNRFQCIKQNKRKKWSQLKYFQRREFVKYASFGHPKTERKVKQQLFVEKLRQHIQRDYKRDIA